MKYKDLAQDNFNTAMQPIFSSRELSHDEWLKVADTATGRKVAMETVSERVKVLRETLEGEELEKQFLEFLECSVECPTLEYSLITKAKVSLVDLKVLQGVVTDIPPKILELLG